MKTTKIILSLALVTLTATSFGQLSSIKDRIFSNRSNEVKYYTADYNTDSRIESWMHDLRDWASERVSRDVVESPVVSQAFVIENAEVVFEEELGLENWMSAPFESDLTEEALFIEEWMISPFETVIENALEVEDWMASAWI